MRLFPVLLLAAIAPLRAAEAPDFAREVRPILSRYCFKCHGPDEKTRKGELRLDFRDAALAPAESGAPAIVPGKPEKSELIVRIFTDDEEEIMPPKSTKQAMTAEQKDVLKRWIAAGAEYQQHWAFVRPKQSTLPSSGAGQAAPHAPVSASQAIDAFVQAKLRTAGLSPSPAADLRALGRRMHFDLIGLPPKPEELDAFVTDASGDRAGAVARLADRLLASPHYGERWARRWLDLARYADTNGYEKDRDRSIWPYRDWVINALNADMPFDQFTIEQLAGDMLPGATLQQQIATGFHRNTMLNEEGGIDPLEFRFHAMTDRVATTGTTWLGLTVGCAQCHTHKYDPITHHEYYQFFAFLNNADEPELDLPLPDAAAQQAQRATQIAGLIAGLPKRWPAKPGEDPAQVAEAKFREWLSAERAKAIGWSVARPTRMTSNLPILTQESDGSIFVSGDITKSDTYELTFTGLPKGITAIRLEALPDSRLPAHGPGMTYYEGPKGDFFLGEFEAKAGGQPVKFERATESYAKNNFGGNPAGAKQAMDGDPQTGWSCAGRAGEAHEAVFVPSVPIDSGTLEARLTFGRHYACSLGRFRISFTTEANGAEARGWSDEVRALLRLPEADLTEDGRARLREHFLLQAPELTEHAKKIRELRKPPKHPTTLVLRERTHPRPTFLHHRGEFTQPKERVEPGVLSVLNPLPPDAPRNRLTFSRWLVSRENPLTARVVVNRAWAAFFGKGLVKTVDDFGFQGETPSHPELLDWLAVDFMESGWSMKKLHRAIVLSTTYQQSAKVSTPAMAKDPENRLLAWFPRTRLEAEMVRDAALLSAGLLTAKVGGPSARPPQPEGVTEVAYNSPKWNADTGENRFRRSVYTFAKRTAPFALYNTFDAPTGEQCVARRDVSNTPLQALTVLNDIGMIEAARALGSKVAREQTTREARATELYRRILGRAPDAEELALMTRYVDAQRERISGGRLDAEKIAGEKSAAAEVAAWALAARALLNLDEALTKG